MSDNGGIWIGPLCGGMLGGIAVLVMFFIAAQRKAPGAVGVKQAGLPYFLTQTPPLVVIQAIIDAAQRGGYKIEDVDHSLGRIILSTPTNVMTWGYFFPVYITSPEGTQTWVEVGAKARVPQWGPFAERKANKERDKCFNMLRSVFVRET